MALAVSMLQRGLAVLVVALCLAPSALAWSQYHGGADRNMRVSLPGGTLDVIRVLDATGTFTNTYWGSRALPTPAGAILLEDTEEGCDLVLVAPSYDAVARRMTVAGCNFGVLVGYDAALDAAILCDNAPLNGFALRAVRVADGRDLWGIIPLRDLGAATGSVRWLCLSAALDTEARQVAVAFEAYPATGNAGVDHAVVMADLDTGSVFWRASVPAQPGLMPLDMGAAPEAYPRAVYPRGVVLTSTGVVVTGFLGCGPGQTPFAVVACLEEGFVAWFTRAGQFTGMESGTKPEGIEPNLANPAARTRGVSQYAVASGPIAAVAVGKDVVLVNPEAPVAVLRAPLMGVEPTNAATFWYAGAWTDSLLLVPILTSLTAFDPVTLVPVWSYTEGLESRLVDIVVTTGGETHVLFTDSVDHEHKLVILNTATGKVVRRLPLPGVLPAEHEPGGWRAHMVPLEGEGLLVTDLMGRMMVLGTADPAMLPTAELSNAFPSAGEEVVLRVDASGTDHVLVHWGDGVESRLDGESAARHVFADRGARDVTITSVFADGTTATRVIVLDVGGIAPARLTALQRAFSAENQEITFFVLGMLITVIGLAVTVGRHRRRFAKLDRELAMIEELRMLSVEDPRRAALELKSYRERLPLDLARRRIDDAQFQFLDLRSARLLKVLRTRMFAPYDARLSVRYHRLLDAAFEDAILQPSERTALVDALDQETGIPPPERAQIVEILDDLTSHRTGG